MIDETAIVVAARPIVQRLARRFPSHLRDDLVQEGLVAALLAARDPVYDPSRVRLAGWIKRPVVWAMARYAISHLTAGLVGRSITRKNHMPRHGDRDLLAAVGTVVGDGAALIAVDRVATQTWRRDADRLARAIDFRAAISSLSDRDRGLVLAATSGRTSRAIGCSVGLSHQRVNQVVSAFVQGLEVSVCATRRGCG